MHINYAHMHTYMRACTMHILMQTHAHMNTHTFNNQSAHSVNHAVFIIIFSSAAEALQAVEVQILLYYVLQLYYYIL